MPRFAPLSLPLHRRLETLSVLFISSFFFVCIALLIVCLLSPWTYPVLIPYLIWTQFDASPEYGGRRSKWLRQLPVWKYMRDFFPCTLQTESELDPERTYVFGYHPHGLWMSFCTEANNISNLLKGITIHPLTLLSNLRVPIWRELLLSAGLCSVDRTCIERLLQRGAGTGVILVPGGAREALDAHPGSMDLTLKCRLGFIRLALRQGADIVPVLAFGENDIFRQVKNKQGGWLRRWQQTFLNNVGFAPCLPYGRGVFNYDIGLLPRRVPIRIVIGKPVRVEKPVAHPTQEEVMGYQQLYIRELQRVYDKYKEEYASDRISDLRFVR